jgi:hypothetical protein
MAVELDTGTTICIQHTLSGTARFTGAHLGRAFTDFGTGTHLVRVRARKYGADANQIGVSLIDIGAPQVVANTSVRLIGNNQLQVTLRRSSAAILATADEVAAAINHYLSVTNPALTQAPVVATSGGTGVVAAATMTLLTKGMDPVIVTPQVKFTSAVDAGGLFYFDQIEPLVVRQMECSFSDPGGTLKVAFKLANLDEGLEVISAETATLFEGTITSTQRYVSFGDANFILLPRQAFIIDAGSVVTGIARVYARRESRFSNM